MLQFLASTLLKLFGWEAVQGLPKFKKYVLIGAPHTSNWDFALAMLIALAIGLRFKWMAKNTIFKNPLGPVSNKHPFSITEEFLLVIERSPVQLHIIVFFAHRPT